MISILVIGYHLDNPQSAAVGKRHMIFRNKNQDGEIWFQKSCLRPAGLQIATRRASENQGKSEISKLPSKFYQRMKTSQVTLENMGVWQGVAMDSLKYHSDPPCHTLPRPAGGSPLKRPYSRFRVGGLRSSSSPHAIRLWWKTFEK
jgi:hypothetical protein